MAPTSLPGAFVVSLDFELHWGMRDRFPADSPAGVALARSRAVVPRLATTLAERGVRATWATVGFLFASSGEELAAASPTVRPGYADRRLDPYREPVGASEEDDPVHLAGSLVRTVAAQPGQEIGSHTFAHYYCLEAGQDEEAFRADLAAAQAIAGRGGLTLTSLVLPRNQWNPRYGAAVRANGFTSYRGPQPSWAHQARSGDETTLVTRGARLAETYAGVGPPPTASWSDVSTQAERDGLVNVPASAFLRPYVPSRRALEPLRLRRLVSGLRQAAHRSRIFHLWWHPHNFGEYPEESFGLLHRLLDEVDRLARSDGLCSMSMGDVATRAGTGSGAATGTA
jgi:peptidoglycan/xylan/chitin deacetylase (PgdA/CDA1 family)